MTTNILKQKEGRGLSADTYSYLARRNFFRFGLVKLIHLTFLSVLFCSDRYHNITATQLRRSVLLIESA